MQLGQRVPPDRREPLGLQAQPAPLEPQEKTDEWAQLARQARQVPLGVLAPPGLPGLQAPLALQGQLVRQVLLAPTVKTGSSAPPGLPGQQAPLVEPARLAPAAPRAQLV